MSSWFPSWSWLWNPSGGPFVETGFWPRLRRRVYDAPIIAHPSGAWLIVGYEAACWWLTGHDVGGMVWCNVLLGEFVNQWGKATRGVYGASLWFNVIWRIVLSAVVTLPAWWWL